MNTNKTRYVDVDLRLVGVNTEGYWDPSSVDFTLEKLKQERLRNSKALLGRRAFIFSLLRHGNLSFSEKIYWKLVRNFRVTQGVRRQDRIVIDVLEKISPLFRLKDKKVGAMVYKLPIPLYYPKDLLYGSRWLLERRRGGLPLLKFLEKACRDVEANTGELLQRKEDLYKIAKDNRPFVKYLNI